MPTYFTVLVVVLIAQGVDGLRKGAASKEELKGQAALDAFAAEPEVGALFGSLIAGVQQAGLLNTGSASFDMSLAKPVLTVSTKSSQTIFGEIASNSRVPVAWKIKGSLRFEIDRSGKDTVAYVTGLGTEPSAQGLALYEIAMREAKIDPTACDGTDMGCIQDEMAAAGKFLLKKKYMSHVNYNRIKTAPGKISKVLTTSFGSLKIYPVVHAKGEWPKIFYSMITAATLELTSFTFEGDRVFASSRADPEADARYNSYHLVAKSNMMGEKSMKDAKLTMSIAEGFAASGMAFAKMLAFGKPRIREEMNKIGMTEAAKLTALQNLFSLCQLNPNKGNGATQDPQCSGKGDEPKNIGRIWWGTSLGASFTDKTV